MTKEQIYDAKIAPLMNDIIAICQDYGIAMIANFSIPDDDQPDLGVITMIPDGDDEHPDIHVCASAVIRPNYGKTNLEVIAMMLAGRRAE